MRTPLFIVAAAVGLSALTHDAPAQAQINVASHGTFKSFGGFFSSLCITQSGSGMNLATCQAPSANNTTQEFFVRQGFGQWTLDGLCLGVPNGNYAAGKVQLETCQSGSGSAWEGWGYESGRIEAFPAGSPNGYCLDVANEQNLAGNAITVARCNNGQSQLFLPEALSVNVVNRAAYLPPSQTPWPPAMWTNIMAPAPVPIEVQQWTHDRAPTENTGEFWYFVGNMIVSEATTDILCVDVTGGAISNGNGTLFLNESGSQCANTASQTFYLEPSQEYTDGSAVTIHNYLEFSGLTPSCLNLANDNTANGTAVNLAACNQGHAQQWILHLDAAYNTLP
jgi:hypothetical protein